MVPVQFFLPEIFFLFIMVYYCDHLVIHPVMVILQTMFAMVFLVTGLVWQFLSIPKITMCAFIVIDSGAKFCHGSTFVLLSANTTFYQIYHHLKITVKFFLYLINFVWVFTFKSTCIFHVTAWLTRRSFSTAWLASVFLTNIREGSSHQMWF